LDALREKRKCVIAQVVQIIDSGRLLLFICTESAEEPIKYSATITSEEFILKSVRQPR
jgi:hypothetical protein